MSVALLVENENLESLKRPLNGNLIKSYHWFEIARLGLLRRLEGILKETIE